MPNIVRTYEEIAKHFGVSRDVVRRSWKAKGMPGKPGRWDLDKIEDWRNRTFYRVPEGDPAYGDIPGSPKRGGAPAAGDQPPPSSEGKTAPTASDVENARAEKIMADARKSAAEAQLKELAVRKALENLVHMEDVERVFSTAFTHFRRRLERVAVEMAGSFPAEHRDRLKEELAERHRMALGQSAEYLRELVEVKE